MLPHPMNYLAVLVSGVAIFILGGLWYSKMMFAPMWMKLNGLRADMMTPEAKKRMPVMLLQALICGLVTAYALAVLLNHFVDLTALRGAMVGVMCWVGFAAVTSYSTALFSLHSRKLWLINSSYNFVSFVIAGVILAVWR